MTPKADTIGAMEERAAIVKWLRAESAVKGVPFAAFRRRYFTKIAALIASGHHHLELKKHAMTKESRP